MSVTTKGTTEAVRRKPYSAVLFDEIEKAHGDVSRPCSSYLTTVDSPMANVCDHEL